MMKRFPPATEPLRSNVSAFLDLDAVWELSLDSYDADDVSDDSSAMGSADGKAPMSPKQTEFWGNGFECSFEVGWFRVVSGGAACALVLVYMSIILRESVSFGQ